MINFYQKKFPHFFRGCSLRPLTESGSGALSRDTRDKRRTRWTVLSIFLVPIIGPASRGTPIPGAITDGPRPVSIPKARIRFPLSYGRLVDLKCALQSTQCHSNIPAIAGPSRERPLT